MRRLCQTVYRRLFAGMPGLFLILPIKQFTIDLVTLRVHEVCDTVAERLTQLLYRHVGIFDRVVQRRRG